MECAVREALEETGVDIELTGFIGVYLGRNKPSFHYVFAGKIKNGIPKASPEEILSVEWYNIDELITMPKDAFAYREKLEDILGKYTSGKVTPIDTVIFDLKKI
jgi:8-oxo-dGTP pyrophosphatase MutT (NUDIX family)